MNNQKRWRVRVIRRQEDWAEIKAADATEAEQLAANLPGVISIMTGMTMSAEKPVHERAPLGLLDDDDED